MNEVERLVDELHRAVHGPAWHGPSVLEALEGVDAAGAARPVFEGSHSIWELVLHLCVGQEVVRQRLHGHAVDLTDAEWFPPVNQTSAAAWGVALQRLREGAHELERAVALMDIAKLDEPIMPGGSTASISLHGISQHHAYHGGQIMMMKRRLLK
ncbi:hypothetical protein BH11PLA1_BH11PLA1_03570 [soil metagenome]